MATSKQASIHMHVHNAVMVVWGSLRLTQNNRKWGKTQIYQTTSNNRKWGKTKIYQTTSNNRKWGKTQIYLITGKMQIHQTTSKIYAVMLIHFYRQHNLENISRRILISNEIHNPMFNQ